MQKQTTLVTNPPKDDPTNKQKNEKVRLVLNELNMDKASLLVYLQS